MSTSDNPLGMLKVQLSEDKYIEAEVAFPADWSDTTDMPPMTYADLFTDGSLTARVDTAHSPIKVVERLHLAARDAVRVTELRQARLADLASLTRFAVGAAPPTRGPFSPAEQETKRRYFGLCFPSMRTLSGPLMQPVAFMADEIVGTPVVDGARVLLVGIYLYLEQGVVQLRYLLGLETGQELLDLTAEQMQERLPGGLMLYGPKTAIYFDMAPVVLISAGVSRTQIAGGAP